MSRETVNNYQFHCHTEQKIVTVWDTITPTKCPNDNTHQINLDTISIINSVTPNNVNIIQSDASVKDNYRVENLVFTVPANQMYTKIITFPYNVGVLTVNWKCKDIHEGDVINGYIAPNATIGQITQNINQGDTIIHVSPSVFTYLNAGYIVNITNGTKNINMGEVKSFDKINNTITCVLQSNDSINTGSLLQMTIHNIRNQILFADEDIHLSTKHLGSSFLPANINILFTYTNNSNVDKTFKVWYEILY